MSHTPGPWVQNEAEQFYLPQEPIRIGPCDEGQFRSVCEIDHLYFDGEEAEANARLIQAAPEMLKALEWIFEHDRAGDGTPMRAARKAYEVLSVLGRDHD